MRFTYEDINDTAISSIAYHGSQDDNIQLKDKPLYLTDDEQMAINFANGYAFDYDLYDEDKPTLYTIQFTLKHPKHIKTEDEYERFMDIAYLNIEELEAQGYDGCVYLSDECEDEIKPECDYYCLFHANKQATIIDSEDVYGMEG